MTQINKYIKKYKIKYLCIINKFTHSIQGISFLQTGHSFFLSPQIFRHSGWKTCLQGVIIKNLSALPLKQALIFSLQLFFEIGIDSDEFRLNPSSITWIFSDISSWLAVSNGNLDTNSRLSLTLKEFKQIAQLFYIILTLQRLSL
jgi:hypothetical protein